MRKALREINSKLHRIKSCVFEPGEAQKELLGIEKEASYIVSVT